MCKGAPRTMKDKHRFADSPIDAVHQLIRAFLIFWRECPPSASASAPARTNSIGARAGALLGFSHAAWGTPEGDL